MPMIPGDTLFEMISEAADFVARRAINLPEIGIILGTGLGSVAQRISDPVFLPYDGVPHMPRSTVKSHEGRFIVGQLGGRPVIAQQGRPHLYEGYQMWQITFGVRIMQRLGVQCLIATNACGGLNPEFRQSDIMVISDHINLMGASPLAGPNDPRLGERFPDLSSPYSFELQKVAHDCAAELSIRVRQGVYAAVPGPNLETRAEYRYLRKIGADVVGMSTVPEVITAIHSGMSALGLSVVTNECYHDVLQAVSLDHVVTAAQMAEENLARLIQGITSRIECKT